MIYHTDEYESERAILGLGDLATPSYYDPAAALIFAKRGTRSSLHELLHLNQLSATTSGLAITAALAYRNMCVEFRVKALNEKFGAGLWSPVLGWLDSLYQGTADEFHDPSYPYYHLSYLKRWIGSADSLLFALGYFDTTNNADIKYWHDRFPWKHIFRDDEWVAHSFYRHDVPFAWMTLVYERFWNHPLSILSYWTHSVALVTSTKRCGGSSTAKGGSERRIPRSAILSTTERSLKLTGIGNRGRTGHRRTTSCLSVPSGH